MFNVPNFLSFLRCPLAFVFLQVNPFYRALAIAIALTTDILDGFIARRYNLTNRLGTLLDPMTDKFFVIFVLIVFVNEQKLTNTEACLLICRDFSVFFYGIYLAIKKRLSTYQFRAIWCGKVTTALQFITLLGLTFGVKFPNYLYILFLILSLLALAELYHTDNTKRQKIE